MRPHLVVVLAPLLDPYLRVHAVPKPLEAQTLVAERSVEGFVSRMLVRLAGLDVVEGHTVLCAPVDERLRGELGAVVQDM